MYDDVTISQAPGGSRGRVSGMNSNHMCRGTLKGEIHREEGLYVARAGAKVYLYTPIEKGIRRAETVKKVPGSPPELREEHSSSQGQVAVSQGKCNINETPQGPVSEAARTNRPQNVSSVNIVSSNPESRGVRSARPLQVQRNITTDSFESEPTVAPTSETTSSDVGKEGFTRNIVTKAERSKSASCTRCSSKKRQSKDISRISSGLQSSTMEMPPLSKPPQSGWSVLQVLLKYTIYIFLLCFLSIFVFEARVKISDLMDEISQVRNEMRAFQSVFESVYGVSFGDARWRRVRIHQGGDVVVLVIGDAKNGGAMSVKKLLEGETVQIDKDALWLEPNSAPRDVDTDTEGGETAQRRKLVHNHQFLKEGRTNKGSASWAEGERDMGENIGIKERVEEHGDMGHGGVGGRAALPGPGSSLVPWGVGEPRLDPWEHVREVVSYALEKCEFIAEEAKETVKGSWARFLRAWRNVWYMT